MSAVNDIERIKRGTVQVYSEADLAKKLALGRSLRVKLGVDPTAPDLHLGHTVALTKLRQFQDMGHTVVFIIGDYTAMIGDPSGRSETRPPMRKEDVEANTATYLAQVFKVLREDRTEVVRNSAWLAPLFANQGEPGRTILGLMARVTVQQLTERDDFKKRLSEGRPVSLLELLYPLLQGFDSVHVKADVELGGTDQLFNLLMGRELQKDAGQPPQVAITLPLLEGTDGVRKMSKSYGNTVAVNDAPNDMFGKLMAIPDALMWKYFELLTDEDIPAARALHPMEAKKKLAGLLTARYHDAPSAASACESFERVFSRRDAPEEMPAHVSASPVRLVDLIVASGAAPSRNEARRLVKQGAVEWDGARVSDDAEVVIEKETILKVGKRQFRRVTRA